MDYIGEIAVPEIEPVGTLSLKPYHGSSSGRDYKVVRHSFLSGDAKIEQRFLIGTGAETFFISSRLNNNQLEDLKSFWEDHKGQYTPFSFSWPIGGFGGTPVTKTVRFNDPQLSWNHVSRSIAEVGINLIEHVTSTPAYTLSSTVNRFSVTAHNNLRNAEQVLIPLIKIRVRKSSYPSIFLSNRRCTIGSQLYQARFSRHGDISQSMNGESDMGTFFFGDADMVMSDLANNVDMMNAELEFSYYHVASQTKIDIWKGFIVDWDGSDDGQLMIECADGMFDLTMKAPGRKIQSTCYKRFDDGLLCNPPGTLNPLFPMASGASCDKGFDTENGCQAHNNANQFGGIKVKPQLVRTKDNSTGLWGNGRSTLTSVSIISTTGQGKPLPRIYSDIPIPVKAIIVAGRDEGDFYDALGVVGAGPISSYGTLTRPGPPETIVGHTLDGFPNHGPGRLGLRESLGEDPNPDPFNLGEGSNGLQTYGDDRAAGTAFVELRRVDEKGFQLSNSSEHEMEVIVGQGLKGWMWSAPGSRTWGVLWNPIWVCVDLFIQAKGLQFATATEIEKHIDIQSAIDAAIICDTEVNKIVGTGTERQFSFRGVVAEEKPLRQWLEEILGNCLGYYTWSFGKLRFGIRINSTSTNAYVPGNIIYGTLKRRPKRPAFNRLTSYYANKDFEFGEASVEWGDELHAMVNGNGMLPLYTSGTLNLSGTTEPSQAVRVTTTRLREEVGGYLEDHYRDARSITFKTTLLGLVSYPGEVISVDDPKMPGSHGELRLKRWTLSEDFSITMEGDTIRDEVYDLTVGPVGTDVVPPEYPSNGAFTPSNWGFSVEGSDDGKAYVNKVYCKTNATSVNRLEIRWLYVDERSQGLCACLGISDTDTTMEYAGDPPVAGSKIVIDQEIIGVVSVTPSGSTGTAVIERGLHGTTPAAHNRQVGTVTAITDQRLTVVGATLKPGQRLVAPDGDFVGIYYALGSDIRIARPFTTIEIGDEVYADPMIYRLQERLEIGALPSGFLTDPSRSSFTVTFDQAYAGLVMVEGRLLTRYASASDYERVNFTTLPGSRLRLGGPTSDRLMFSHPAVPGGVATDIFESFRFAATRPVMSVRAEVSGGSNPPVQSPRSVAVLTTANVINSGAYVVSGTIAAGGKIHIHIGNGTTDLNYISVPVFTITTETTYADVAAALADWMNAQSEFNTFFQASASGASINILDKIGTGGTLGASTSGGVTVSATGLLNVMAITKGRRYAVVFKKSDGSLISPPSELSASTGPTGGARRIEIHDLPSSSDPRVDQVLVYATPNGGDGSILRLVATVGNGTTYVADDVEEFNISTKPLYGGPVALSAPMTVTLMKDSGAWIVLRVDENTGASDLVNGLCVDPVAAGSVFTVDCDNAEANRQLTITLR